MVAPVIPSTELIPSGPPGFVISNPGSPFRGKDLLSDELILEPGRSYLSTQAWSFLLIEEANTSDRGEVRLQGQNTSNRTPQADPGKGNGHGHRFGPGSRIRYILVNRFLAELLD